MENLNKNGVYKITNVITNDFYIGSTWNLFKNRFAQHKKAFEKYLKEYKSSNPLLHNAFKKYDISNFKFEILEIIEDKSIIRLREEFYIKTLNPKYNICKEPSKGGSPNLGRKLSKEWKNAISKKSSLYKHSDKVKLLKAQQNKDLSSKYRICNLNFCFEGSLKDCAEFSNSDQSSVLNWANRKHKSKIWKVFLIKTQKKKLEVFINDNVKTFDSFNKCDKFFNMWRGYTSSKILKRELILNKYAYNII